MSIGSEVYIWFGVVTEVEQGTEFPLEEGDIHDAFWINDETIGFGIVAARNPVDYIPAEVDERILQRPIEVLTEQFDEAWSRHFNKPVPKPRWHLGTDMA